MELAFSIKCFLTTPAAYKWLLPQKSNNHIFPKAFAFLFYKGREGLLLKFPANLQERESVSLELSTWLQAMSLQGHSNKAVASQLEGPSPHWVP